MRDIKFRAWDKGANKWLLGYEYPNLGGFSLFGECMLLGEWSNVLNDYILNYEAHGHKEGDLVVMQFTGLLDKNGKPIYEGDIVIVSGQFEAPCSDKKDFETISYEHKGIISFETGMFVFKNHVPMDDLIELRKVFEDINLDTDITSSLDSFLRIEVIGNIFENPELIEMR